MTLDIAITQITIPAHKASTPTNIAKNEAPSITVRFSKELANVLFERNTNELWLRDSSILPGIAPGCEALDCAATRLCTITVSTIVNMPQKATE